MTWTHTYRGRLGRPELRGQRCRILQTWRRQGKHNVKIELEGGEVTTCPIRCLRKENSR